MFKLLLATSVMAHEQRGPAQEMKKPVPEDDHYYYYYYYYYGDKK